MFFDLIHVIRLFAPGACVTLLAAGSLAALAF
jgi:hypothetical protein